MCSKSSLIRVCSVLQQLLKRFHDEANQLLQLSPACLVWSESIIMPDSFCSDKSTTLLVAIERKGENPGKFTTVISSKWIKIGLVMEH